MKKNTVLCPHCKKEIDLDPSAADDIFRQIRDGKFDEILAERVSLVEKTKDAEKEKEVASLRAKALQHTKSEEEKWRAELDKNKTELAKLNAALQNAEKQKQVETELAVQKAVCEVEKKKNELEIKLKEKENETMTLLKYKDEEIKRVTEHKAKLVTKLVGETLEQDCEIKFNEIRAAAFPLAYFGKDNDATSGTKGDYIFRDYLVSNDGEPKTEIISIMFEMKNKSDDTKGQKNESYFAKLDKDRKAKKCEYAVLVTMLEEDNPMYNNGIYDISYKYDKMYVIRPQFFIPVITFLRNAALKNAGIKKELETIKNKEIDIVNFEDNLNEWKDKVGNNSRLATERFQKAIAEIDKSIKSLEATKKALMDSEDKFQLAERQANEVTLKRLYSKSPTIKAEFVQLDRSKKEG
ncbi:MAG: DUF2130 domain-containing protein [Firmicutes bacterium]|nr:DUF2130 domain-containing protein [Bacillota bacterium]